MKLVCQLCPSRHETWAHSLLVPSSADPSTNLVSRCTLSYQLLSAELAWRNTAWQNTTFTTWHNCSPLKINIFEYPIVIWSLVSKEPPWISTHTLYCENLKSLCYISAADSMGLSSFKFMWRAPKTHACMFMNVFMHVCMYSVVIHPL